MPVSVCELLGFNKAETVWSFSFFWYHVFGYSWRVHAYRNVILTLCGNGWQIPALGKSRERLWRSRGELGQPN